MIERGCRRGNPTWSASETSTRPDAIGLMDFCGLDECLQMLSRKLAILSALL
jgi:hypothetical protein